MLVLSLEIQPSMLGISQELYPNIRSVPQQNPRAATNGEWVGMVTIVRQCIQALIEVKDALNSGKFVTFLY